MEYLDQILTVPNVINVAVAVGIFSVKTSLNHINDSIKEAKDQAAGAHRRIDEILKSLMKD